MVLSIVGIRGKKDSPGIKIFTRLRLSEGVVDIAQLKYSFQGM